MNLSAIKKTVLLLFLSGCVMGCSSNRYLSYLSSQAQLLVTSLHSVDIPVWTELNTAELYRYCVKQDTKSLSGNILQLTCADQLLHRENISEEQRYFALSKYNKILTSFITPQLDSSNASHKKHDNFKVVFNDDIVKNNEVFLTDRISSLDQRLHFNTFGELGVSAVIVRDNTEQGIDEFYPLEGVFRPITFTFSSLNRIEGQWILRVNSHRLNQPTNTRLANNTYELTYSPAAAYLLLIEHANIDELSWTGLVSPASTEERMGIFSVEKINHKKIPIIMIHGLNSDPLIWRYLTLAILNDKSLHDKYQIWHVYFPSGPPPFYNAMMLRRKFKSLLAQQGLLSVNSEGVFIGHSMGGIIAKTMVTDSGYLLWDRTFNERPATLLNNSSEKKIRDIFIFSPVFNHSKVFFLDTPHLGSATADSFIGYLGSALVTLPETFLSVFREFIDNIQQEKITKEMWPFLKDYGPNSVQVLRPGHPLIETLNTLPIRGEVYSIIGSQSKLTCKTPYLCADVSDGVVPYPSAHNKQAISEILVSSSHDSYQSEKAIRFIIKNLQKN